MNNYIWDEDSYDTIKAYKNFFDWHDIAEHKHDFDDWALVPCPILWGSDDHKAWNKFFKQEFKKDAYVTYDFIVRVLCSVMICASPKNHEIQKSNEEILKKDDKEIKEIDWTEIGYTDEDDFLEDYLGLSPEEGYTLEDFLESWNPDW